MKRLNKERERGSLKREERGERVEGVVDSQ